jgi:hypothetical protein
VSREPSLFDFWGRELVKDLTLLVLAIPPAIGVLVALTGLGHGRWLGPLGLAVVTGLLWWAARRVLLAWVARGDTEAPRATGAKG